MYCPLMFRLNRTYCYIALHCSVTEKHLKVSVFTEAESTFLKFSHHIDFVNANLLNGQM